MESTLFNPIEPELIEDETLDLDETPVIPALAERPDYKKKDMILFDAWKQSGSKEDMSKLVEHLHPIIFAQVHKQAGSVPNSALAGVARTWAVKAIQKYDPSKGAALSTHVANYIQKIKRQNYKYRGVARLAENKQLQYQQYQRAKQNLTDELDREPYPEEMAKQLKWTKGMVVKFQKLDIKDTFESAVANPTQYETYSDRGLLLQEILSHLTPEERILFEQKGQMPAPQLAAKLGVNTNRLNYLQKKLIVKIQKLKRELGFDNAN